MLPGRNWLKHKNIFSLDLISESLTVLVACSCGLLSSSPTQHPESDSNYEMQLTRALFSLQADVTFDKNRGASHRIHWCCL